MEADLHLCPGMLVPDLAAWRRERTPGFAETDHFFGAPSLELAGLALLRPFGLKVGRVGAAEFERRVRALVRDSPRLAGCMEALLRARAALRKELAALHAELLRVTQNDELCRRSMTIPGVGPVTALAFKTTIDRPDRFRRSADVGAHLGLAPRQHQSGETDRRGRIIHSGDAFTRSALYTAAHVMLTRSTQWTALKAWGVKIAKRSALK